MDPIPEPNNNTGKEAERLSRSTLIMTRRHPFAHFSFRVDLRGHLFGIKGSDILTIPNLISD